MSDKYDEAIAELTALYATNSLAIERAYLDQVSNPHGFLFRALAPLGVKFSHPDMIADPYTAKYGLSSYDGYLYQELFDASRAAMPTDSIFLKPAHLAYFADWQRRFDQHWLDVERSWAEARSSFTPQSFADWLTPSQRRLLVDIGATGPKGKRGYDPLKHVAWSADARCQAELGIGLHDLSQRAAMALAEEWREQPVWRPQTPVG